VLAALAPLLRHETRIGSNASMTSMVAPSQLSTASVPHASGNCIGHFYVAKSVRMAYLSIPKSGCTSLINMLHAVAIPGFSTIGTRIHRESTLPRVPAPACPAGLLRFTFVRNPYLRLLSFYRSKVLKMADPDPHVNMTLLKMGLREGMSFASMVEVLSTVPPRAMDLHCAPQILFVYHIGKPVVDFVGRLESLQEDWSELEARCGVHTGLLQENMKHGIDLIDEYRDPSVRARVHALYRADFETFGYASEL